MDKVVAAVDIARIDADLLFAAEHQHRRAGDDQRPQRQQLFVLQRVDRVIRLDCRQNAERIALAMMQQRGTGHRQIGNAPGAHQVAEIDHALQLPMALRIALPHHVVVGDVHVNGLHRQFVLQWLQMPLGLPGRFDDQFALGFILDHWQQMRDQGVGMAGVPLQGSHQPRMVEIRQGQVHFTAQATETGHHRRVEMTEARQRLAFDVVEQANVHRLATHVQRQQVCTVFRRDNTRHIYIGVLAQMLEPGVLRLKLQYRVVATADFQDETSPLAVDAVVQVLLAAKGLQPAAEPVMFFQQL
ncbi:hypothetical protein D3C80_317300 [compost metagenome]